MALNKLEVARRQLGTALELFLADGDPVSIHILASAGCEIAEGLVRKAGLEPFSSHALSTFPNLNLKSLREIQRSYSNAFKHITDVRGQDRKDEDLLNAFTDKQNDAALFIGWYDYLAASGSLPLEAQAFQAWYFALHPEALGPKGDPVRYSKIFPGIAQCSRTEQKRMLREIIERYRTDEGVMQDPKTDPRPLILPAV